MTLPTGWVPEEGPPGDSAVSPPPACRVCGATSRDLHDGAAHDLSGVIEHERKEALRWAASQSAPTYGSVTETDASAPSDPPLSADSAPKDPA